MPLVPHRSFLADETLVYEPNFLSNNYTINLSDLRNKIHTSRGVDVRNWFAHYIKLFDRVIDHKISLTRESNQEFTPASLRVYVF